MPAHAGPILRSPTAGFNRVERVKMASAFMRSPLGVRIKSALETRMQRAQSAMGVTLESILDGDTDLSEAIQLLSEAPPPFAKKKKDDDEEEPEKEEAPPEDPNAGLPDPRLADLASGAIDLQPEDGPTLDDVYDSAILRVNAVDALDFFVASDIEQDLAAFLLFFSPMMPVTQAAQLLQSLKEIMPGTQIVQGPLAPGAEASPPPPEDDEEEPEDDEEIPDEEEPEDGDEEPEDGEEIPGEEEPIPGEEIPGEEEPEDGEEFPPEEEPEDGDDSDEEEPEDGDEEDDDDEDDEEEDEEEEPGVDPTTPQGMQVDSTPQFDTTNPHALPWVFLVSGDEVNIAADGSVTPPEDEQDQGITGFPEPGEEKPAAAQGGGEEPGDGGGENPFAKSGGDDEEPEDGKGGENPFAKSGGGEEPEDGEEEPEDGEEEPPEDGEEIPPDTNEPGDLPGAGKEPGDGVEPGDGELPGPAPDDDGEVPDDEFPPDDDEEDPEDDDDDDDEDEEEEENDEQSTPGILFDSVNSLLGEEPK